MACSPKTGIQTATRRRSSWSAATLPDLLFRSFTTSRAPSPPATPVPPVQGTEPSMHGGLFNGAGTWTADRCAGPYLRSAFAARLLQFERSATAPALLERHL